MIVTATHTIDDRLRLADIGAPLPVLCAMVVELPVARAEELE